MTNEDLYCRPIATLLHATPLSVAEIAARSAYDSFDKSEEEQIQNFPRYHRIWDEDISESKILNQLSWVHFHESTLEHCTLNFHIHDISRGVLMELSRHRIASYTVKSTRYTMTPILLAFAIVQVEYFGPKYFIFQKLMKKIDFSIFLSDSMLDEEIFAIYAKLEILIKELKNNDYHEYLSKAQSDIMDNMQVFDPSEPESVMTALLDAKAKKNAGDDFKAIVTDNWKTELVWSINLRSLKNFLKLRNSNSAYFQIRWLAEEIEKQIPERYLELIIKSKKK